MVFTETSLLLHLPSTAVTDMKLEDLLVATTVTLTNVGTNPLYEVQYMRNVDPDQEQPWTDVYSTRNYVLHQPYRASDGVDRRHPTHPNMCLVIADAPTAGYRGKLVLGLGASLPCVQLPPPPAWRLLSACSMLMAAPQGQSTRTAASPTTAS
jgi:hypothetical protein